MEMGTMTKRFAAGMAKVAAVALVLALAVAFALGVQPARAVADEGANALDVALKDLPDSPSIPAVGGLPLMGDDYVWFGDRLNLGSHTFENDVLAAGRSVELRDCEVSGSVRVAAQDIEIDGLDVSENVTVAGESITIGSTKAKAVAVAGKRAVVGGSCESLVVYASDVFINGEVEGDVVVGANSVEIGPDARIKGTLHVNAPSEPVMQRGAEVADVEFEKSDEAAPTVPVGDVLGGFSSTLVVVMGIVGIIGTLIVAVLAEWLFRRHTAAAADMIRARTGAFIGTGIVGAIVAPLAIIILCVLVITLPVAGALTLALLAMTVVAGGFAGASLFKLAFPKLGRFACALAGGAIVGVAGAIPILGRIVQAAAFMYFLGYVLQSIYLNTRTDNRPPVQPEPQPQPQPPLM
ncbi:MAG: polymer-forming cytoskeletal protein [Eggerthellaceae bacterium]|nr:polymer-forming cytoskeletal protein [Eggerthellaceae bacterium]